MQQFIRDLNQLYCLKSHLTERIIDLEDQPSFSRVKHAIKDLVAQTDLELENLDLILVLLNKRISIAECKELADYLEEIYTDLTDAIDTPKLAHVLFYEYLSQVKQIEKIHLSSICRISMTMANPELQVLLLKECEKPDCELLRSFKKFYPASFGYNIESKGSQSEI